MLRRSGETGTRAPDGRTGLTFRPDIEGLRAVAVGLVVLDHLAGWPAGGFIGVDVFFVISGFLITSLLLDETARHGRLSIRAFYARRARRILPAAVTVLAAVVVAAHFVFRGVRVTQTVTDATWALGFAANIHFARIGTDYFQANRPPSLVQHYWSLAVEEQFYLVWPLLILIVLTLARRWAGKLLVLLGGLLAGTVTSFVLACLNTSHNPTAAYFSSPDRAWELGLGALIAVARAAGVSALPPRFRGPLLGLGLVGIGVSAFVVPDGTGFPAPWALLPVAATVAVIVAGQGGELGRWAIALTNPVSRYLGRISYSLYLWHWPVILVVAALVPHPWPLHYAIAVFAMLGLAIASYHFVEAPLRRLHVRTTPRRRLRVALAPRQRRTTVRRPALASLACLVAVVVLSVLVPGRPTPSFASAAADAPPGLTDTGPSVAQPPAALSKAIDQALRATHFPDFDPPLSQLGTSRASKYWHACDHPAETDPASCSFGSTDPHARVAVVIGDSIAMSWLAGVDAALAGSGWRVYGLTFEACPAADIPVLDVHQKRHTHCDQHHAWVRQAALRLNPQLVVLASTDDTLSRLADGATGTRADAEYRAALRRTIAGLHPGPHRRVLTLAPPPLVTDVAQCNSAASTPADCVRQIDNRWITFARDERAVAAATHTSYTDTHLWFCNAAGYCPAFIGRTLVRWDGQHMTDVFAQTLAGELRGVLGAATAGQTGRR